jgi:hypothetical protein
VLSECVLPLPPGIADGVRDLAVVERRSVDGALWVVMPFDDVHSVGVLECAARIAATVSDLRFSCGPRGSRRAQKAEIG